MLIIMSLYQYLIEEKKYTKNEAEEAVIRWQMGEKIPKLVKQDIFDYYH